MVRIIRPDRKPASGLWPVHVLGIVLILLAITEGKALVVQGSTEVRFGQGLVFGSAPFSLTTTGASSPFDSKTDFKKSDLIVATTACPLCLTCCCLWEIGSTHPFFLSRTTFDSTDFSKALDLKDTAKFLLVDTLKAGSTQTLPHTAEVAPNGRFYVFLTSNRKHVLMKIREVLKANPDSASPFVQCPNGMKIDWWSQDNGEAYFPAPTSIHQPRPSSEALKAPDGYQVNGTRIKVGGQSRSPRKLIPR